MHLSKEEQLEATYYYSCLYNSLILSQRHPLISTP